MNRKKNISILLAVIGMGFLVYGGLYHARPVFNDKGANPQRRPESALVREVTVGGLARTPAGLRQTYSGLPDQGPALCPT